MFVCASTIPSLMDEKEMRKGRGRRGSKEERGRGRVQSDEEEGMGMNRVVSSVYIN